MLLLDKVQSTLAKCTNALPRWSRGKRTVNKRTIREKYETLRKMQEVEDNLNLEEIRTVQRDIDNILKEEDLKWSQRAKLNWYQLGDHNTKFFSACVSQRRKKNQINHVKDEHSVP